jgi:CubicO group peptidase (beta-lactamase class C family)
MRLSSLLPAFGLAIAAGAIVVPDVPAVRLAAADLQNERRASLSAQVDGLFAQWTSSESPGAAVLVMQDGQVVHARGYGMANLEHGIPTGRRRC